MIAVVTDSSEGIGIKLASSTDWPGSISPQGEVIVNISTFIGQLHS
jgi:hypothetical protein